MTMETAQGKIITPPNTLKSKVGSGGLSKEVLEKAETVLKENTTDFRPSAQMYLDSILATLKTLRSRRSSANNGTSATSA